MPAPNLRIFIFIIIAFQILHGQSKKISQLDIDLFAKDCVLHRNPNHRKNLNYMKMLLDGDSTLYGRAEYMTKLATSYYVKNQLDSAAIYYNRAIGHHDSLDLKYYLDNKSMKEAYYMLGRIYSTRKDPEKAIKHGNKSLFYEKKYPDKRWKPYLLTLLARCHLSLGSDEKALDFFFTSQR